MKYADVMSQGFQDELRKIASQKEGQDLGSAVGKKLGPWKIPAAIAGGVVGWEALKRLNRDRKLGRHLRRQSKGRY
jgi:hypothetical protein